MPRDTYRKIISFLNVVNTLQREKDYSLEEIGKLIEVDKKEIYKILNLIHVIYRFAPSFKYNSERFSTFTFPQYFYSQISVLDQIVYFLFLNGVNSPKKAVSFDEILDWFIYDEMIIPGYLIPRNILPNRDLFGMTEDDRVYLTQKGELHAQGILAKAYNIMRNFIERGEHENRD